VRHLLIAACAVLLIAAAPVLAPGAEADRAPDWLVRPDGERIARFYPEQAQRAEKEGAVSLVCIVAVDTLLRDCKVVAEDPPGYGCGRAALNTSEGRRLAPAIRQGLPVESTVRIPLAFKFPDPQPPARLPTLTPPARLGLAAGLLLFATFVMGGLLAVNRAVRRRP